MTLLFYPITRDRLWALYKTQEAVFWTKEELDLCHDKFDELASDERRLLMQVLMFFAFADGAVVEQLMNSFLVDSPDWPECKAFYAFQAANEVVHAETYTALIQQYCKSESERRTIHNAVRTQDHVRRKAQWIESYMDRGRPYPARLVAFACLEGVMFSAAFAIIFYLKSRGRDLPGLYASNEFIARDEGLHCIFACEVYDHLPEQDKADVDVASIVSAAVGVEHAFIDACMSDLALLGINAEQMKVYVRFVADVLMRNLGKPPLYNADNPFPFMDSISLQGKTNFFERRVTEYVRTSGYNNDNDDGGDDDDDDEGGPLFDFTGDSDF